MAVSVSPQDILRLGFRPHQFSLQSDTEFVALIQSLIEETTALVGAAAVAGAFALAANAARFEIGIRQLVEAELWSRRAIGIDSEASLNRRNEDIAQSARGYMLNAKDRRELARGTLDGLVDAAATLFGADASAGGLSSGYVETERFAEAAAT